MKQNQNRTHPIIHNDHAFPKTKKIKNKKLAAKIHQVDLAFLLMNYYLAQCTY